MRERPPCFNLTQLTIVGLQNCIRVRVGRILRAPQNSKSKVIFHVFAIMILQFYHLNEFKNFPFQCQSFPLVRVALHQVSSKETKNVLNGWSILISRVISNLLMTLCLLCKAGVGSESVTSSLQKRISLQQMTTPNSELSKKQQKASSAGKEEFGTSNR